MNNEDLRKLKAAALAATQGTWDRSNRPIGPFYHISSDHGIDGICSQGRQSIGTMNATDKKAAPQYAEMFQANADFVITFQPKVVLALIAEVEQARIANGWLPIETAPKDGTKILILTDDGIIESFWRNGAWDQSIVYADYGAHTEIDSAPTYWQPLPAIPQ